jgi:hypothetical protein
MADLKKFLDQSGVSTLWSRVAEEVKKVDDKAVKNAQDIAAHAGKIQTMEGQIAALEAGTYDDSEVRGLIADNKAAHEANAAAIATLNSGAEVVGSVANTANAAAAAKVAEIVAGANADFDTLKEIADWILNDTTGAADMANDIAALQGLVGDKAVATQIAEAISAEGLDKYALAADLTTLAGRVKALEDADYASYTEAENVVDGKIAALDLANTYDAKGAAATAETNAKAHADGLNSTMDVRVKALEAIDHSKFEAAGAAATALADAKAYTETEIAKIQALTPAEIDAAIEAAKAQA